MRIDCSVILIPFFKVDIPTLSERIWFLSELPGTEANDHVESGEIFGPTGLSTGEELGGRKIFQVFVICDHVDRKG